MPPKGRSKRKAANPKDDVPTKPKVSKKTETAKDEVKSKSITDPAKGDSAKSKNSPTLNDSADKPCGDPKPRLAYKFYDVPCDQLAKDLLGKTLVTQKDGERLAGTIVETEAYMGVIDKAAHSYEGKRTDKTEAMFMQPGTAYVYNIYGLYCCLNISAQGEGAAVLLRAVEAKENLAAMNKLRTKGKPGDDKLLKHAGRGLTNGPSKMAQAFGINKASFNKQDMCTSNEIWLEESEVVDPSNVVTSTRINIDYAKDWTEKPLRFYIKGNKFVSVVDKEAEKGMES